MPHSVYGGGTEQSRIRSGIRSPRHCTSQHVTALHFTTHTHHVTVMHFTREAKA